MLDDAAPAQSPLDLQSELDKSRESAAHLLENLARKIAANRAVRHAATGVHRAAHCVQAHSVKDVATGVERLVRTPAADAAESELWREPISAALILLVVEMALACYFGRKAA